MTRSELVSNILKKKSFLCVGLDTDITKIPQHLLKHENPVLEFNRQIIDATREFCVAYKPNTAFYEAMGAEGWNILDQTANYISHTHFTIADAKRGDIGNTSGHYARAFFQKLNFDSITVAPYMGEDSVKPFLEFEGKWVILLALTSNPGSQDFQVQKNKDGNELFTEVLKKSQTWASADNLMYVVGATRGQDIARVRSLAPEYFFLVPGVGAQGGDLDEVCRYGMNKEVGLLINASRSIIYASSKEDYADVAHKEAKALQKEMEICLDKYLR
ncbi:MAG: orotidine-5'-phosphate decarboxylase [Cytophagaceae bacterium]